MLLFQPTMHSPNRNQSLDLSSTCLYPWIYWYSLLSAPSFFSITFILVLLPFFSSCSCTYNCSRMEAKSGPNPMISSWSFIISSWYIALKRWLHHRLPNWFRKHLHCPSNFGFRSIILLFRIVVFLDCFLWVNASYTDMFIEASEGLQTIDEVMIECYPSREASSTISKTCFVHLRCRN